MDKLCLTFLQKGHTENENDSVHSVIERATKYAVIYSPEQWYSAMRTARKSKTPHYVEELTHAQFIDYKTMSNSVKNPNIDDEGNKVKWSSARQFLVYGTDPQALYLTYKYGGAEKPVDVISLCQAGLVPAHITPFMKVCPCAPVKLKEATKIIQ